MGRSKENQIISEIRYEIIQKIGILSTSASGWSKELNLISWNDREPTPSTFGTSPKSDNGNLYAN
jgi:hypothetical protein